MKIDLLEGIKEIFSKILDGSKGAFQGKRDISNGRGLNDPGASKIKNTERGYSKDNAVISEKDMVRRLKILLSIPISSAAYSDELDIFLEQIWNKNMEEAESEAKNNELTLYEKRLRLLKQYANEKNKVRVNGILDRLLDSLNGSVT